MSDGTPGPPTYSGLPPSAPTQIPGPPTREKVIGNGISWLATWSWRWILIAIALVIVSQFIGMVWSVLMPVAMALIVTTVLAPVARSLERWLKFPPAAAAAATLLGGVGAVIAVGWLIAPSVAGQTGEIVDDAIKGITHLQDWVNDSNFFNKQQIDDALSTVQSKLSESASAIASGVLTGVGAATSAVVTLVVVVFLVFFFLKDGRHFLPWVRGLAGPRVGTHLAEVGGRAWNTLGGFIRTQALVSGIDAVFIGIGLLVIGVPLAIPLAIITFFGGFIPIVGAFAAGAIAVLVALVSNGITGAVWVILLVIAVQQIEGNILSPILQSKSMNLHPALVLLSVTLGSTLFGIVGAFLAVPAAAVAAVVLRYINEQIAKNAGEPAPEPEGDDDGPSWIQRLLQRAPSENRESKSGDDAVADGEAQATS